MKLPWKFLPILGLAVVPSVTLAQHYTQTNLIADSAATVDGKTTGVVIDKQLSNPWGLSRAAGSPFWINDNNSGVAELYTISTTPPLVATQVPNLPFVTIPTPDGGTPPSAPSGIVFAGEANFNVGNGKPALFIFVTEDGTISAWDGNNIPNPATRKVDNSKAGAVYKGCTIAKVGNEFLLFATNFNSGKVEVYNENFTLVTSGEGKFEDPAIPEGFAPFNVANIGGELVVTYAKQNALKHDPVGAPGNGFVDIFSAKGNLITHLQHGPWFNSPWGVVLTPRDFGAFSNTLLIGNFGSDEDTAGEIAAFDPFDGNFLGLVLKSDGSELKIPNLWSLEFGDSSGVTGPSDTLFFTAGPGGEKGGLFGALTPVPTEANELEQ